MLLVLICISYDICKGGDPAIAFVKLCAKTATVWHCDRSVSEVAYIVKTSMSSKNYNYTAG